MLIAHIREVDSKVQSVQEHLEGVGALAYQYGVPLGIGKIAELAGFLHDMGKFTMHFSDYLRSVVLHQKNIRPHIDHSTAGAKYLYERYWSERPQDAIRSYVIEIVGMAILSHHSGLHDFLSIDGRVNSYIRRTVEKELPHYEEVVQNFQSIEGNVERVDRLVDEATEELAAFFEKVKKRTIERESQRTALAAESYLLKILLCILSLFVPIENN